MGIIASPTEQTQFVQALRLAREGGWSDVDIARTLSVSNGDFKNMITGHKLASQKHVLRLNGLMKSSPPKSIKTALPTMPPPAPSRPVLDLPKFNSSKAELPKPRVPLFVGDDGGQPRAPRPDAEAPAPTEPPKERTEMTTTEAVNGMSNGVKSHIEDPNARYRLLSTSAAKALRAAMNEALLETYGGDFDKMAKALQLTANGLRKTLGNKSGSISEQTRNRFAKATGWTFDSQPTKKRAVRARAKQGKKPGAMSASNPRGTSRVPTREMNAFRKELGKLVGQVGNTAEVARGMGVNRNTLAFILNGKGTTYETIERFHRYQEGLGGTTEEARPAAPKRKLLNEYGPSDPPSDGGFDLYGMAGRLLAAGRPIEAHVLSLVARVSETASLDEVTEALGRLIPHAATG